MRTQHCCVLIVVQAHILDIRGSLKDFTLLEQDDSL